MKKVFYLFLGVSLTACVHTPGPIPEPDYKSASQYNYELGAGYARDGLYDTAMSKLQKAVEQDPNNAEAYAALGYVYSKTGRNKEAYDNFQKAITIDAEDPIISNNFGVFLCGQHKSKEAYQYFDKAANNIKYKNPEVALTNAGLCARESNDLISANDYLNRALAINPDFHDAKEQMIMLDYQKHDYQGSLSILDDLIDNKVVSDDAIWAGVKDALGLNDSTRAKKYAQLLLQSFPHSHWVEQAEFVLNQ